MLVRFCLQPMEQWQKLNDHMPQQALEAGFLASAVLILSVHAVAVKLFDCF